MTSKDILRKLDFLVQQLVESAETQARREFWLSLTTRTDSVAASIGSPDARIDTLAATVEKLASKMDALVERMDRLEHRFSEFDARFIAVNEQIAVLTAAQGRTDERLNNLINAAERYITRNGGTQE